MSRRYFGISANDNCPASRQGPFRDLALPKCRKPEMRVSGMASCCCKLGAGALPDHYPSVTFLLFFTAFWEVLVNHVDCFLVFSSMFRVSRGSIVYCIAQRSIVQYCIVQYSTASISSGQVLSGRCRSYPPLVAVGPAVPVVPVPVLVLVF